MRFTKRLAIAIDTQGTNRPFVRQKELKHLLIGTEKLSKLYIDQISLNTSTDIKTLTDLSNIERLKVSLASSDSPLTRAEVQHQDHLFLAGIDEDVEALLGFITATENFIAVAINSWLCDALVIGLVFRSPNEVCTPTAARKLVHSALRKRAHDGQFLNMCGQLAVSLVPIVEANEALNDHISLNIVAINKLMKRRDKNVDVRAIPEKELPDYESLLRSERAGMITTSLAQMRHAIEDVYERSVTLYDPKFSHHVTRLGVCLNSTTANSPSPSIAL